MAAIIHALKEQSTEIFFDLQFFLSLELTWAIDQQNKIFSIIFKISPSYSNVLSLKMIMNKVIITIKK